MPTHKISVTVEKDSIRVNPETLERNDSPEQIDSWNRTWAFFLKNLK